MKSFIEEWRLELNKMLEISKSIINNEAIAIVHYKGETNEEIEQIDYVHDYIYFGMTKVAKSLIAIQNLISIGCNEDALVITRSNFEIYMKNRAVIRNNALIDNFIQLDLGLFNKTLEYKRFDYRNKTKIIRSSNRTKDKNKECIYLDNLKTISKIADESYFYENFYGFLSEVTHCHMSTIGYYISHGDSSKFSYESSNRRSLYNVLYINLVLMMKLFRNLLDGNLIKSKEKVDEIEKCLEAEKVFLIYTLSDEIVLISNVILVTKNVNFEELEELRDYRADLERSIENVKKI